MSLQSRLPWIFRYPKSEKWRARGAAAARMPQCQTAFLISGDVGLCRAEARGEALARQKEFLRQVAERASKEQAHLRDMSTRLRGKMRSAIATDAIRQQDDARARILQGVRAQLPHLCQIIREHQIARVEFHKRILQRILLCQLLNYCCSSSSCGRRLLVLLGMVHGGCGACRADDPVRTWVAPVQAQARP